MCANNTTRAMRGKSLSTENNALSTARNSLEEAKGNSSKGMARITVVARKRPLTILEERRHDSDVVKIDPDNSFNVVVEEPRTRVDTTKYIERHEFKVDRAFAEYSENTEIYKKCVKNLIEVALKDKAKVSCFAYGQTGSGKTFTMLGPAPYNDKSKPGIFRLAAADIFEYLNNQPENKKQFAFVSFYEIYCGKLFDLLQKRKMVPALENGKKEVIVKDLKIDRVDCEEDLVNKMIEGSELRKIGANSVNYESSRSHAVLQIDLKSHLKEEGGGKIVFIDLAGSERGADTMYNSRSTQLDGAGINSSLLALKECIRAMDNDNKHIPFRNSELTKVLRDIFVGKSHSIMIVNVSPASSCCEQTLNTLRYATRVKNFRQVSRTVEIPAEAEEAPRAPAHVHSAADQSSKRHHIATEEKPTISHTKLSKPSAHYRSSSISHTTAHSPITPENQSERYRNQNRVAKAPSTVSNVTLKASPPNVPKEEKAPTKTSTPHPTPPRYVGDPHKPTTHITTLRSQSYLQHTNDDTFTHSGMYFRKNWKDGDVSMDGAGGTDLMDDGEFFSLSGDDLHWLDDSEKKVLRGTPKLNAYSMEKSEYIQRSKTLQVPKPTTTPRLSKFGYLGNIVRQKGGEAFTISPFSADSQQSVHTHKAGRSPERFDNSERLNQGSQYFFDPLKDSSTHTHLVESHIEPNGQKHTHLQERFLHNREEKSDGSQLATTSLLLDAPFDTTPSVPMSEEYMAELFTPTKSDDVQLNEISIKILENFKNLEDIGPLEIKNLLFKYFGINRDLSTLHLSELSMFGKLCYRARQNLIRHLLRMMQASPTQHDIATERYIQKFNDSERIGEEFYDFVEAYMNTQCTLLLRKRQLWVESEKLKYLHKAIAEEYQIKSANGVLYGLDDSDTFSTPSSPPLYRDWADMKEEGWFSYDPALSPMIND